ncbi:Hydrocephalus-inducing protein [Rhizoctonia solani]|uniref:Hydrocephalus-inducing protein n=1 Tax=Rhizoctonia solani TaxID=456999 RepID=A0A0K6G1G4_9AGAM|nr:Hydrocephalus-inducing protein [Rhizoctonia solani]
MSHLAAAAPLPADLITSTSRISDRLKPVHPVRNPSRFSEVLAGIARTKKILILSGDTALSGCGIPPLDSIAEYPEQPRRTTYWNLIRESTEHPEKYPIHSLTNFNRIMTERRITARQAQRLPYFDYLHTLCKADRLTRCLTTSIDGLEAKSSVDVAGRVTTIYGDNRFSRCLVPACEGLSEEQTSALDDTFRTQKMARCEACWDKNKKNSMQRRFGTEELRALRPCVQARCGLSFVNIELSVDDDGEQGDDYTDALPPIPRASESKAKMSGNGKSRGKRQPAIKFTPPDPIDLAGYDGGCHLFLLLGAPPKDPDLLDVTRDLAASVHGRGGAVVYIDPGLLHGTSQHDHIDIHLQADIQETLSEVMKQMEQDLVGEPMGENIGNDADLWFELIQNELPVRHTQKDVPYDRAVCAHCSCGIEDYLAECTQCRITYCYRRVQEVEDSEDSESDSGEATTLKHSLDLHATSVSETSLKPPSEPLAKSSTSRTSDSFPFYEACIAFNMFHTGGRQPSLAEAKQSFICPDCWNFQEKGLYPHYVRPPPRDSIELTTDVWPRLALVVFYVEDFWPQTKHLVNFTTGFWRQLGWEFVVQPVKLQHLKEREDPFANLEWQAGSYQFIAVFLTHGLTGDQGYQLNNHQSLRPTELLAQSLPVVQTALYGASASFVFYFSCGHPMRNPSMVKELCDWVNLEHNPAYVFACLNKKLSPIYMFNLFNKVTKALAERPADARSVVQLAWMRDSIACSHSDLLCVARNLPAELWLYAPFQSRPLGKALPSLLSVCSCKRRDDHPDPQVGRVGRRKIWKVEHKGKAGDKLKDIELRAICRACGQWWLLSHTPLEGHLSKVNGVFGAIVPYFR